MTAAQGQKSGDVPAVVAVAMLGVVVGGLIYFKSPATFGRLYFEFDRYAETHLGLLSAIVIAFSINCVWFYSICSSVLGLNQQGKRLEVLRGKKGKSTLPVSRRGLVYGMGVCAAVYLIVENEASRLLPRFLPRTWQEPTLIAIAFNFGLCGLALISIVDRSALFESWRRKKRQKLCPFPKFPNTVVLGSVDEESDDGAKWVVMNHRALTGNILITGSIGSGKTQGAILCYFDQLLANFLPRPAILALDPKSTFIQKAIGIIGKYGLSEHALHLRLGGNVTFNPVYLPNALKNGGFSEIAQMLRAAAVNFGIGSSQDSAFWEVSSYNLIKNILVYCAATQGYYTLRDLYTAMVRASDGSVAEELQNALAGGNFDEEEKYNINCAIDYLAREFYQLESKVRTSILATATSFLNQFQEYQASRIFCPKENELTIKSMDEVVEQGKLLLFDVKSAALARSMGTFVKLHYMQAVLNRYAKDVEQERGAVILVDEYQDVATVGGNGTIGDDKYLAKAREANAIFIAASQSLSSLENAIGRERATRELVQSFRTRIACHSSDISTIKNLQELFGQEEKTKESHSISELAHHASRNLVLGGFEAKDANISESVTTSEQKEYLVTGKELSRLSTFEAFAQLFDGVRTHFKKLFLKPYYLKDRSLLHKKVLEGLERGTALLLLVATGAAFGFPNVCTVLKTDEARSCLDFSVGACICPGIPPRPCARMSYYVPQTFIEVMPDPKSSYFGSLPGAAVQLETVSGKLPFGIEADTDSQSFHAHTIAVPLAMIPFSLLPCGGARLERFCFDGMSEHLGSNWSTGKGDLLQPKFLAWSLSPKACLLKGAIDSAMGGSETMASPGGPTCSVPLPFLPTFPPSSHEACNGWGLFYPRCGTYTGPSQTMGALMIGSRIKSLSTEVFHSTPASPDEKWQMISPQSSSCFREGQNVGLLETVKNVRELGRITSGKLKGYLFVVWSKVSCCQDLAEVPAAYIAIEAMMAACKGLGEL